MSKERQRFISRYRKSVDTYAPPVGRLFRRLRDAAVNRRTRETRYNFTLAGDPLVIDEGYESDEIAAFLELLDSHDVVVDVGANVGFYSCLAASRGKQVVAVEPSPRNLTYLKQNLWENGFRSVEVFPVGLGRVPGLSQIYGFGCTASFVPGWAQAETKTGVLVSMTTLDAITASLAGKRLLIKMDVEGFEYDVLTGAERTLSHEPSPSWLIEIILRGDVLPGGRNDKFRETFALFWNNGYKCRSLEEPQTWIEEKNIDEWIQEDRDNTATRNFLFVTAS